VFVVLLEDSAALIGIAIAAAGILVGRATGLEWPDPVASMLIGALLMLVAVILARESWGLLIGEAADPVTLRDIDAIARADPAVRRVGRALTAHFGPDTVVLDVELEFRPGLASRELVDAVARIERSLRRAHPELKYIFLEARRLAEHGRA
jgi:divalent metal cation (Fe/Co/Zn/Cd) transporter